MLLVVAAALAAAAAGQEGDGVLRKIVDSQQRKLRKDFSDMAQDEQVFDAQGRELFNKYRNLVPSTLPDDPAARKWVQSRNLANYLRIRTVAPVEVPVLVNLVFLGFQGQGNTGIKVTEEDLRPWFEHIEQRRQHTHTTLPHDLHHKFEKANVEYKYYFHVIEMHPKVNNIIEGFIHRYRRPEDGLPLNNKGSGGARVHYVETSRFVEVVEDFLDATDLKGSYTLLIMNPNSNLPDGDVYGYRYGFSDAELAVLRGQTWESLNVTGPGSETCEIDQSQCLPMSGKKRHDTVTWSDKSDQSLHWSEGHTASPLPDAINEADVVSLAREAASGPENSEERLFVEQAVDNHFLAEDCLVDTFVGRGRYAFLDLTAGPFEWGPIVAGEGVRTRETVPSIHVVQGPNAPPIHGGFGKPSPDMLSDALKGELDLVVDFLDKYCFKRDGELPAFCGDIEERRDLLKELETGTDSGSTGAEEAWGKLTDLGLISRASDASMESHAGTNAFYSQLGALIGSSLSYLWTPSTPLVRVYASEKVNFNVFVVTNHRKYDPLADRAFNLFRFKKEMSRFRLPHQDFSFTVTPLDSSQDTVLANAMASSMRTVVMPQVDVSHKFTTSRRMYLDSAALRAHLLWAAGEDMAPHNQTRSRDVPVFLFSVDYGFPLFVDKVYQARALKDMVIAVQSPYSRWDSDLACNGKVIEWNLRNPTKAILASTAQVLGGLIPPQVTFDEARGKPAQDWTWATGSSPGAHTSHRSSFSEIHIDTVHRNYAIGAIERSVDVVNNAVAILEEQETDERNFDALANMEPLIRDLRHRISVSEWLRTQASNNLAELQFAKAARTSPELVRNAHGIEQAAMLLVDEMTLFRCVQSGGGGQGSSGSGDDEMNWMSPVIVVIDLLVILLVCMCRDRRSKLKLN